MSLARALAILGAGAGAVGLVLQFVIMARAPEYGGVAGALWRFIGYFTILTNLLVTAVLTHAALRPAKADGLSSPRVELMALVSILFVCAVYNILLAPRWDPQGWQLVADILLHQGTPAIFALYWLARPHGRLDGWDALFAALWPSGYAAYGLTRGALDGFYPYFFMDASALSIPALAFNLAGLILVFLIGAVVVVGVDRALGRRA